MDFVTTHSVAHLLLHILICCLLKSMKSYGVSESLVKEICEYVCVQCSPVLLRSLIPKQIFQLNKFNKMSIFTQCNQEMKEGGSKHREREREKSSAQGVTAFMLMQHGMISLRSFSSLRGLDHFFIPLKATLQSGKKHQLLIYI